MEIDLLILSHIFFLQSSRVHYLLRLIDVYTVHLLTDIALILLDKSAHISDVEFITEEQRIRPGKSEVHRLWCDNTKIRELTGFEPEYSIRKGLEATIEWFTKPSNLAKYKADIYNV